MDSIFHRVSIRKYEDRAVEPEKIERLLRAGFQAPSATDQQPWEFYVVTDKKKLAELAEGCPYGKFVKDAPLAIIPCYRKEYCSVPMFAEIDLAIATENIWLEADALGLGAVWLGTAPIEEQMTKVERILDMPEGLRAFAVMPVGYPAETREQKDRFHPERIHYV